MSKYLLLNFLLLNFSCLYSQEGLTIEELDKTIEICNRELDKNPNNEMYLMGRADAYMIKDEYGLALKDYIKLSGINNTKEINYKIGRALLDLKKYDTAIKNFSMVIDSDSLYYEAYLDRGIAYFSKNNYKLALSDFFYIQNKTNEYSYRVDLNIGVTYFYMGMIEKAELSLKDALKKDGKSYYALFYLAGIMSKKGDFKSMCDYYNGSKNNGLLKNFTDDDKLLNTIKLKCD